MPTAEEIAAAEAAKAAANKEIETLVHSAVATHLKTALPKALEGMKTSFTEALAPTIAETIKAQFDEAKKTALPPPKADEKDLEKSPAFLAMQKRLDDADKARIVSEQRAVASEKKQRDDAGIAAIRAGFAAKVRPELLDVLTTAAWAKGQFKIDEKGEVLMKVRRAPLSGLEEVDQELPLKDGLDHWFRTKDAEPFLPPPKTAAPPGQRAPGRAGSVAPPASNYSEPAKSDAERGRRAMEREAQLAELHPNLTR